ncbi:MAG: hypothetical protein ACKOHG_21300, partial [Planctomycetia bacterium]
GCWSGGRRCCQAASGKAGSERTKRVRRLMMVRGGFVHGSKGGGHLDRAAERLSMGRAAEPHSGGRAVVIGTEVAVS